MSPSSRLSRCSLAACLAASLSCAPMRQEETVAVPSVASIPVAPLGTPSGLTPAQPPSTTLATPTPTPTPTPEPDTGTGPLNRTPEPDTGTGTRNRTPESDPATEPPSDPAVPTRVVLADEVPYRYLSHPRADGAPVERAHPRSHRRGKPGASSRPYHPAPGIVIDVTDGGAGTAADGTSPASPGRGRDLAEWQRAARNAGYWPVRRCYEEGLRRDQTLSGRVSLDVALSPGGIERAVAASTTVHDESVTLCIAREASHLPLASNTGPAQARMDVTLATGDEPVLVPPPAPHADQVRDALRASWPAVERCYASELTKHPDLGGRLELRFRARGSGEIVEVAEEGERRFADVDVTRCVLGVYRAARLPLGRARTSRETSFAYAMHLESAQNTSPLAK